jgi:predicted nucleic acid-binding protein
LILSEPVVSEFYYKNARRVGKRMSKDFIIWLKSLPNSFVYDPDDNDAFFAGDTKLDKAFDLSIVDCFVLAVARANRAILITTDHSLRDSARSLGLRVDWLPLP